MAMEITGIVTALKGYDKLDKTDSAERGKSKSSSSTTGKADSVSLSSEAKLVSSAMSAAQNAPEVRRQKVEELKALVESGQYQPDLKKTAAKIVEEDLELLI